MKKKLLLFYKPKVFILLTALFFLSCSSENTESSLNVSSYYPVDISPTAFHEKIIVQFTKVSGIGAADTSACSPAYQLKIGTNDDVNSAADLGVILPNDSLLVRFSIKKSKNQEDEALEFPFFYFPQLTDNQEYTIWLRSDFTNCGYGYSNWVSAKSSPVPLPTQVENIQVQQGDNHLRISWTKKQGELYAVHLNDCPSKAGQDTKWTPAVSLNSDHYIVELENNSTVYDSSNGKSICIVSHNANGFIDSLGKSTWKVFGVDIYNQADEKAILQGKAATLNPEKPVINRDSIKGKHKRAEFTFNTVSTGESAVSKYQAGYSLDGKNFNNWVDIPYNQDIANAIVSGLENNKLYYIKIRASNSFSSKSDSWVESDALTVTPEYTPIDINDANQYLGTTEGDFIYAENVPHSDFWRISTSFNAGGRQNSDRLVRGKETALGNLFADGVYWYGSQMTNTSPDFAFLIGDMISQGMQANMSITPALLKSVITSDYIDDTLVIVTLKGSDLINNNDYSLNLNQYPVVGDNTNPYTKSLFGQAASVYRNGHYGGSGGTVYNGRWWGIPSSQVKYTIEYKAYDFEAFKTRFDTNCSTVDKKTGIDSDTKKLYDAVADPKNCYILTYEQANPESGNPTENSVMGYKRGRIKSGTLKINNNDIIPEADYKIITTTKIAKEMYVAFLGKNIQPVLDYSSRPVTLITAMAEYIAYKNSIKPYLDGRITISGGVPGDTANDFRPIP